MIFYEQHATKGSKFLIQIAKWNPVIISCYDDMWD